jgi:peptidyl-prolyl cis-trans isomerase B (cyclophilin B)
MFNPPPRSPIWDYDFSQMNLVQLEPPKAGQPIVTVETVFGEFKAMLFPDDAPNTVENFIARVEEGFYDNKPVIGLGQGLFFISGALNEEGNQGKTMDGKLIANEYSVNLWAFKGSLLSFSGTEEYGDSRFVVIGSYPYTEESEAELREFTRSDGSKLFPEELIDALRETPNIVNYSGRYTIFGQIFEGMDTLDKILAQPVAEDKQVPLERILIDKITLTYHEV